MKKLFTILLCVIAFALSAQTDGDMQHERLLKKYKGQQRGAFILGACSMGFIGGYFIVNSNPPDYIPSGNTASQIKQGYNAWLRRYDQWKSLRTGLAISGLATGVVAIITGVSSAKNKSLYENRKVALSVTDNNGLGLCLWLK